MKRKYVTPPMPAEGWPQRVVDRFWSRTAKAAGDACWEWQGNRLPSGYGRVGVGHNATVYTHRLAWNITHGAIPSGMYVCHRCDNPRCVRPDHLFLGTNRENQRDAMAKGRHSIAGVAKLTPPQVAEIRGALSRGEKPRLLADRHGVSVGAVYLIGRGETWRGVLAA